MFERVTEQEIFPTTLWIHDLDDEKAARLNAQLFRDLDQLTAPRPKLLPGQNWQTDQVLHELEEFQELVEIFTAATSGVLDKMGFDEERLQALNPRLIKTSITGYGKDGPYAQRPSFDFIAQAMSGFFHVTR